MKLYPNIFYMLRITRQKINSKQSNKVKTTGKPPCRIMLGHPSLNNRKYSLRRDQLWDHLVIPLGL